MNALILPASSCKNYKKSCTFDEPAPKRGVPKAYVENLEERVKTYEQLLKTFPRENISEALSQVQQEGEEQPDVDPNSIFSENSSGMHLLSRMISENKKELQTTPHVKYTEDTRSNYIDRGITAAPWDLPPNVITQPLFTLYFNSINKYLPIVDEDEFYRNYCKSKLDDSFMPLVITVCLVTSRISSASEFILRKYDKDRKSFCLDLHTQLVDSLDFNYLESNVNIIQTLLLLTCQFKEWCFDSSSQWITGTMGIRSVQDLGLHRMSTFHKSTPNDTERRKQLWWSTFVIDKWFSCVTNHPFTTSDSDMELPLKYGADGKENFQFFVHFIQLSRILGDISRRIYSCKARKNGFQTEIMEQNVCHLHKCLKDWLKAVPDEFKINEKDRKNMKKNPRCFSGTSKTIEGGPLMICYYAVMIMLYKPFYRLDDLADDMPFLQKAKEECRTAARTMLEIVHVFPVLYDIHFGWNIIGFCLFQAALIHLYDYLVFKEEESRRYLDLYVQEILGPFYQDPITHTFIISYLELVMTLLKEDQVMEGVWTKLFTYIGFSTS